MSAYSELKTELKKRYFLSSSGDGVSNASRFLDDSGINRDFVDFDGSADDYWSDILFQAVKQEKLINIKVQLSKEESEEIKLDFLNALVDKFIKEVDSGKPIFETITELRSITLPKITNHIDIYKNIPIDLVKMSFSVDEVSIDDFDKLLNGKKTKESKNKLEEFYSEKDEKISAIEADMRMAIEEQNTVESSIYNLDKPDDPFIGGNECSAEEPSRYEKELTAYEKKKKDLKKEEKLLKNKIKNIKYRLDDVEDRYISRKNSNIEEIKKSRDKDIISFVRKCLGFVDSSIEDKEKYIHGFTILLSIACLIELFEEKSNDPATSNRINQELNQSIESYDSTIDMNMRKIASIYMQEIRTADDIYELNSNNKLSLEDVLNETMQGGLKEKIGEEIKKDQKALYSDNIDMSGNPDLSPLYLEKYENRILKRIKIVDSDQELYNDLLGRKSQIDFYMEKINKSVGKFRDNTFLWMLFEYAGKSKNLSNNTISKKLCLALPHEMQRRFPSAVELLTEEKKSPLYMLKNINEDLIRPHDLTTYLSERKNLKKQLIKIATFRENTFYKKIKSYAIFSLLPILNIIFTILITNRLLNKKKFLSKNYLNTDIFIKISKIMNCLLLLSFIWLFVLLYTLSEFSTFSLWINVALFFTNTIIVGFSVYNWLLVRKYRIDPKFSSKDK